MREKKAKVGKISARLKLNGVNWSVAVCLLADDTVLLAENERELQRVVDQFHSLCRRRKLRVNAGKSKVIVFERKEVEMINFGNPYRVSVPVEERRDMMLGGERMEVIKELKYLGTVLSQHGKMEYARERERAVKDRSVMGSLYRAMKGRNVSMEVKRGLWNSILWPTFLHESETGAWTRAQQS